MPIELQRIAYTELESPRFELPKRPADLSDGLYLQRKERLLTAIKHAKLDGVLIYADREHGGNFGYLTGFEPRFEEALLLVLVDGTSSILLGNECYKMHAFSRIPVTPYPMPCMSLPNQPMKGERPLVPLFNEAGIFPGMALGLVGWKLFTGELGKSAPLFDLPHYLVDAAGSAVGNSGKLINATGLFIDPDTGIRITVQAEEAAEYEFGAATASYCVHKVLDQLELGSNEQELASSLAIYGMPLSCYSMCATGERFTNAVVYPRDRTVQLGDRFTVSMGLRGGLTCRAGYIANTDADLPADVSDYLDAVARPYFAACASWLSLVGIGVTGGQLYQEIEAALPQSRYGWKLNPGHFIATEEWLSSPIEAGSQIQLRSGMMLQMDLIPGVAGYGGCNAEDGLLLADESLRSQLETQFPQVWARMQRRRTYLIETLGIPLKPEVLPLSDSLGYLRPFLLNRGLAFKVIHQK